MIHNDYKNVCSSCTVCIVLFVIGALIIICISVAFIYFQQYVKKNSTNINPDTETTIY